MPQMYGFSPVCTCDRAGANYWFSAYLSVVLYLQVVGEIVAPRKLLMTMLAFIVPAVVFVMLAHFIVLYR